MRKIFTSATAQNLFVVSNRIDECTFLTFYELTYNHSNECVRVFRTLAHSNEETKQ